MVFLYDPLFGNASVAVCADRAIESSVRHPSSVPNHNNARGLQRSGSLQANTEVVIHPPYDNKPLEF